MPRPGTTPAGDLRCRPMARDQRLAALSAVPLFSACTKRELQKLARAGDEVDIEAGRRLVDQGATGREAFFILDGVGHRAARRSQDRQPRTG